MSFTAGQLSGLVITNFVASIISLAGTVCVLIVHGILLSYRPKVVNRLSLRLIVLSSIFDGIYSASQIAVDYIDSRQSSCRVIIFILISTDTMACMCLAVIGLNLVMILAMKVSRTKKLEIFYYVIIAVSGVLVSVVPRLAPHISGPLPDEIVASCW
jgi:hypothetical protein